MDFDEFKTSILSTVKKYDPYRANKQLHLKNWCRAYYQIFKIGGKKHLPFFYDVLSDNECWEQSNTIHRIQLNRKLTAKKIVQAVSPRGRETPLDHYQRYQIACWCCLEEDITSIFEYFKQHNQFGFKNEAGQKQLTKFLNKNSLADPLTGYWSYIIGGYISELESGSKHLYEHGLDLALKMYTIHVEAVEFFWNKIKSLSEDELSASKKELIFMNTAVAATGVRFTRHPEVLEFCVSQLSSNMYVEFLQKDFADKRYMGSFEALQDNLNFRLLRALVSCFKDMSEETYGKLLAHLEIEEYPEYYAKEAVKFFMYVWKKKEFNKNHAVMLQKELVDYRYRGTLLVPFVKKNYMEPVWAVLDKATQDQIKVFLNCEKGAFIRSVLEKRGDNTSLNKFLSYKSADERSHNLNSNAMTNSTMEPENKRLRTEEVLHTEATTFAGHLSKEQGNISNFNTVEEVLHTEATTFAGHSSKK